VRILCFFAIIKKLKSFSKQQKQTRRIRILWKSLNQWNKVLENFLW
jgi:hypothetical protein